MICKNCGAILEDGENFCSNCGLRVNESNEKKFCSQCGKELDAGVQFCAWCGTKLNGDVSGVDTKQNTSCKNQKMLDFIANNKVLSYLFTYKKCLPAFIIGLVGGILGMFGGLCTTMCSFSSSAGNSAFLLIFCGAVIAVVGSCLCLTKARIGSAVQLLGTLMIIIRAFSHNGAEFLTIFSFVFLLVASVIGIISSYFPDFINKK